MTVRLVHPLTTGNLDQAPVSVSIVSAQGHDVLAVPISALVALAGGGYAVEVVHGSGASATRHSSPCRPAFLRHAGPGLWRGHHGGRASRGAVVMTGMLEVRDVGKTYPGTPPVRALVGVSLTVRRASGSP